jgi:AAA domain
VKARPITAQSRWQTWCIFGASGVGKTALSATAPHPYICDSNQGLLTIADRKGLEHVRGDEVTKMSDLDEVYDNFTGTGQDDWTKKFETINFDHFDDIQGIILDQLADKAMEKDSNREADQLEQREYGIMGNKLRRYLRKMKKLPKHKILICGEMINNESGRLQPRLLGAMKNELPYFCDHVAYLRVGKKGVRYLHLNPGDEWMAKTRARWLTPEQRKIRVDEDDITALTTLFTLIAAGPSGTLAKKHKKHKA